MWKPIALVLPVLAALPSVAQTVEKKPAPAQAERPASPETASEIARDLERRAEIEARIKAYISEREAEKRRQSSPEPAKSKLVVFHDDFRAARVAAATAGSPLLVNMTGYTAVNARVMETRMFAEPDVASELTSFVEARLHTDVADESLRDRIQARAHALGAARAIPIYVALDPRTGRELGRFNGSTSDSRHFSKFLSDARVALGGPQPPATSADLWGRIFDLEDEVARLKGDVEEVVQKRQSSGR